MNEEQYVVGGKTSPGEHFGCRLDPVSAKDVADPLIGNRMAEIGQGSRRCGRIPDRSSLWQCGIERLDCWGDWGPAGFTEFGAVEFSCNESAIPGEDSIGFGDTRDLLEPCAAQSLSDLSEGRSLWIGKGHTAGKVGSEDAILGYEGFILEQEFLIDQPGDVCQQPCPFCSLA
jgi:hypothetical protein